MSEGLISKLMNKLMHRCYSWCTGFTAVDTPDGADYGVCEGRLTCHTNPGGPSIGAAAPQEAAHHMFPRRACLDHPQK